jgi:SAM-dependent methyltransferase
MGLHKPTVEEVLAPRTQGKDPRPPRKYSWSESMTPGFSRAVEIAMGLVQPGDSVLDVPCGKGEAIIRIASLVPTRAVGVDHSMHLLQVAKEKTAASGVVNRAQWILADGGRLPFPNETFELCLSIGGPSCIGGHTVQEALQEQARITKPGGCLVLSDMFRDPSYPNPWIDEDHPTDRGWWESLESVGLRVISFEHFSASAWDEYHSPMRDLVAAVRQRFADDPEKLQWADEVEKEIAIDRPVGNLAFYGAFIARKP